MVKSTVRVWLASKKTMVVSVPLNVQTALNIEQGDILEVDFHKVGSYNKPTKIEKKDNFEEDDELKAYRERIK